MNLRPYRFSVIEMIIVLVLALSMIGLSFTAFDKLGEGNLVSASSQSVGSALVQARQFAVAKKTYTAVVMPADEISVMPNELKFGAYRVCKVTKIGSRYEFDSWAPRSTWMYARKGTSIMEVDNDVGIRDGVNLENIPNDNSTSDSDVVYDVDLSSLFDGGSVKETSGLRAIIFKKNGRVASTANFVTVGTANYNAGTWLIDNPVTTSLTNSTANQVTIELNIFTGAIRYLNIENY